MKKLVDKIFKIFSIIVLIISTQYIVKPDVKAATYNFNVTGPQSAKSGDTLTFSIVANGLTGNVKLAGSNVTLSANQVWVEKNTVTFTATVTGFPASVTATPVELTDNDYNIVSVGAVTRNISKIETPPQTTPEPEPETNQGGGQSQTPTEQNKNEVIPQDAPQTQTQTTQETKSQNNHLSSLVVNDGVRNLQLKQTRTEQSGFNRDVEDYTVVFDDSYDFNNLEVLKVDATKEDSKAKISGTGNYTINEGDNTIEVKCTAEDGKVKTYRIKVTKPIVINKSELKLDTLEISYMNEDEKVPIILDNLFSSETYEYTANIDADVNSIFVKLSTAKVKDKDIIVKIKGKEISRDLDGNLNEEEIELEDGKNTIRITLISPVDEEVQTDYVLTLDREGAMPVSTEEVSENKLFGGNINPFIIVGIIAGIIVLLLIVLIVLLIINHKRKKKAGEKPYLNEEKIEGLNQVYTNRIDGKENMEEQKDLESENKESSLEKNDEKSLEQSDKKEKNDENSFKQSDKIEESSEDIKIDEDKILKEAEYELLSDEERKAKLEQLEKELKDKRKK